MMSVTRCTLDTISCMALPASSTWRTPPSTAVTLELIRPLISLAAAALRCARLRTSPATTAKPRPCSPARAASTAAFSARMLVWKAMESIRPMMSPILRLEEEISCMLFTACCTTLPPRVAMPEAEATSWLATCEDDAVCCTVAVSCESAATASCALLAVCSVRPDRSWLPVAISWLAVAMLLLASRTCATIAPRPFCMSSSARCRSAASSRPSTWMR